MGAYPFIEADDGAYWAEPDTLHAAQQMRAAKAAVGSDYAIQLIKKVEPMFSTKVIGARMH